MLLRGVVRRLRRELGEGGLAVTAAFKRAVETRLHPQGRHLRLLVRAGQGCGGFTYEFAPEAFDTDEAGLVLFCADGASYLAVRESHLPFLAGAVLDFEQSLQRTAFEVRDNPNALSTCSCRKSFSPKPETMQAARSSSARPS